MSTTLSRKFRLDVTSDLTLASGFIEFKGIDDLNPNVTPTTQDTTAYDTSGWMTHEVTLQDWTLVATAFRRLVAGVYDPGQELVRACVGQFGTAARVGVRWYDKNGGPEAYSGIAIPTWARNNTAVPNVEKVTVTFSATDIPLNMNITNPGVAAAAPVVLSAAPSGAAAGAPVQINGVGFATVTGAAGVKFGGVNAASYIVVSDNVIVAVVPAGSAGSAPIVVTNGVGASNSLPYTRA